MSDELPKLPTWDEATKRSVEDPVCWFIHNHEPNDSEDRDHWRVDFADALRAYARSAIASTREQVIEECAAVCDSRSIMWRTERWRGLSEQTTGQREDEGKECASAVRALKSQPQEGK